MKVINEDFQVHGELNPKIWDSFGTLLPEVRKKILEIVNTFEDYVEVPMDICDIQIVGSNASYNYTDASDLDVHIISNFELVSKDTEILQALYDAKKSNFNSNYDISIRGIEIELYVQDVKSATISNGIYSVCDNVWIKEPKPIKSITKHNTEKEFTKWKQKINQVLQDNSAQEVEDTINTLYLIRHNSIAVDGEYGAGNQLFKDIRSAGLLDKLKNKLVKEQSKMLSLESFTKGQLVNKA